MLMTEFEGAYVAEKNGDVRESRTWARGRGTQEGEEGLRALLPEVGGEENAGA